MRYCFPEIPPKYWMKKLTVNCGNCKKQGIIYLPDNSTIIEFKEIEGKAVKFLPVYGVGGYLDLMEKIMEVKPNQISMKYANDFDVKLRRFTEPSSSGKGFTSLENSQLRCNQCGSFEVVEIKEDILTNPKINWLKVSCDLL